jgi:hypothetical protein
MGWNDGRISPQSSLLADEELGTQKDHRGALVDVDSGFIVTGGSTDKNYVPPSLLIPELEVNGEGETEVDAAATLPVEQSARSNNNEAQQRSMMEQWNNFFFNEKRETQVDVAATSPVEQSSRSAINDAQRMEKWNIFFLEKTTVAGLYVKEKSEILRARTQHGHLPLSVLAFLGGCGVVVVNSYAVLVDAVHFHLLALLFSTYCLVFGLMVCLLEGRMWSCPTTPLPVLLVNANFLKYVWGRGSFYLFTGTMQCFKRSATDLVVGGFLCLIGLLLLIDGRHAAEKLSAVSLPDRKALKEMFIANDGDNDGFLEYNEFGNLLKGLGVELTANELEVACSAVDQDGDEKISKQELFDWWGNFHGPSLENSSFVSV